MGVGNVMSNSNRFNPLSFFVSSLPHNKNKYINISLYITYLLQRINTMSKSNPIFIPFSMLNNDNKCVTYNVQNFTGKVHMTLDGVLICSTDYDGLEEDLEEAFNAFGLGETNRQLIRGVVLESSPVTAVVNDEEAAVVAAATAAAAADGFDGNEELVAGESPNGGHGDDSTDVDDEEDEDDDTVTELPSSKLQFDSDDDSYDEDQHFSQQATLYS